LIRVPLSGWGRSAAEQAGLLNARERLRAVAEFEVAPPRADRPHDAVLMFRVIARRAPCTLSDERAEDRPRGQGNRGAARHGPDTGPGRRVTGAGPRTRSRQKAYVPWRRMKPIAALWIPSARTRHPWPQQRFLVQQAIRPLQHRKQTQESTSSRREQTSISQMRFPWAAGRQATSISPGHVPGGATPSSRAGSHCRRGTGGAWRRHHDQPTACASWSSSPRSPAATASVAGSRATSTGRIARTRSTASRPASAAAAASISPATA